MCQLFGLWEIFGVTTSTGQMLNSMHVMRACDPGVRMRQHNVYKVSAVSIEKM